MELKHTPGPWKLKDWTSYDQQGVIEAYGEQVVDANDHMVSSATIEGASEGEEANARLIAAAPELLSACLAVMDAHAEFRREYPNVTDEAPCLGLVREAVAKATGSAA
jgi:hypothetical protein